MIKEIYPNMNELLNSSRVGRFSIDKFTIDINDKEAIEQDIPPGEYTRLIREKRYEHSIGFTTVMSNTPSEMETNIEFVNNANGHVLIAGLGLGMVLLAIQDKETVKSITVIERFKDVIQLVSTQLPLNKKVSIIHANIYNWIPENDMKYDTIYFDIWDTMEPEDFLKLLKLKERFKPSLNTINKNAFIKGWLENERKAEIMESDN